MEVLELLEAQLQELLQLAADVSLHQVTQLQEEMNIIQDKIGQAQQQMGESQGQIIQLQVWFHAHKCIDTRTLIHTHIHTCTSKNVQLPSRSCHPPHCAPRIKSVTYSS